jgi:hypothetical protein
MTDTHAADTHATHADSQTADATGHPSDPHGSGDPVGADGADEHDHEETLGPVDWPAWTIGAAGVAVGCVMWLCFAAGTAPS